MTTEINVISGFLGAGKTTLIQKLLKEAFHNDKVVLIENDFGEISVDAALLKAGGVEVREINSGCICCSLSGDFVQALAEILDRFHPDKIIIEPSGVGKLSDIVKACSDQRIHTLAEVKTNITVVDVKRCKTYLENFGEFFEDQIQNADVILFSRTEIFAEKIDDACKLVKELNAHSYILTKPWNQITADEILNPQKLCCEHGERSHEYECKHHGMHDHGEHEHSCTHDHGEHEHGCDCEHNHSAKEVFDTVTIQTMKIFSPEDLQIRLSKMERSAQGTILRAKGIVRSANGFLNLQYIPGDIQITNCAISGNTLCIIGNDLNQQELGCLFDGE